MELIFFILIYAVVIIVYFMPMIVAKQRNHRQLVAIAVLNLFAGWTFIGWLAALVWACTTDVKE